MNEELVVVATFGQEWEAHLAQNLLEQADITSFLIGENVLRTVPYAADPTGIKLQVRQSDMETAKIVLERRSASEDKEHE